MNRRSFCHRTQHAAASCTCAQERPLLHPSTCPATCLSAGFTGLGKAAWSLQQVHRPRGSLTPRLQATSWWLTRQQQQQRCLCQASHQPVILRFQRLSGRAWLTQGYSTWCVQAPESRLGTSCDHSEDKTRCRLGHGCRSTQHGCSSPEMGAHDQGMLAEQHDALTPSLHSTFLDPH